MTNARYRFGSHVLDLAKRELLHGGAAVALPARVFECLVHLIEHRDRAVDRDELARAVFSRDDVSDAQLAQIILRSRRAIGDDGQEQRAIRTVPRFGYRWVAETTVEPDMPAAAPPVVVPTLAPAPLQTPPPVADEPVPAPDARLPAVPVASRKGRGRRALPVAAVLVLVASVAVFAWQRRAEPPAAPAAADAQAQRAIMVLPTRVEGPGDVAWARLGLMDYLADRIRRGGLPALSSDTTLSLLRDAGEAGPAPNMRQLREAARVDWIVESQASRDGGHWRVQLRATDRHGLVQRGKAQGGDLLDAARVAGDRLLAALGGDAVASDEPEPGLAERLQRARSAMLANELDTARRILNEAPELQRARPQLRYRLAQVDFRAGQYQRGLATLDELLAGDAARADPMFRARLLNSRGAMLIRLDRYAEAERSYDAAIDLLERRGTPVELGGALTGRGVTRSSQGRFDQALADLGRARVQLLRGGDALAVARVDANLGNLEMDRERPAQAVGYFEKAARDFESMGAVNELAGISGMLLTAHLQLLKPEAALAESDRGWALLPRIRDPAQRANVLLGRAEALIAVGRLAEAGKLLAMPEAAQVVPGDYKRRDYLRMELARQAGDPRAVMRIADAALDDWPPERRPRLRAWLELRRDQAADDLGLPLAGDATTGGDLSGDGVAQLLRRAIRAGADGEPAYRAALVRAEQRAIPKEVAEAVVAHAHWRLARGQTAEAGGLAGRAAPWAEQDFALALLQVELYARLGLREQWEAALVRARELAGERPIPPELLAPLPPEPPAVP
ncbi:winged helix-turn-helix domain-containing protein [Luteimonas lutimaris]|uniref:OmpR/PhoB-type domain-containing protein n=1 Tax=Luteimonas lutimaris TaxID=698645 RepID=A0ABP7M3B5_9GAMM|nr:winged helix-turn-helix domain-containing protein [Luteimonas sp.]